MFSRIREWHFRTHHGVPQSLRTISFYGCEDYSYSTFDRKLHIQLALSGLAVRCNDSFNIRKNSVPDKSLWYALSFQSSAVQFNVCVLLSFLFNSVCSVFCYCSHPEATCPSKVPGYVNIICSPALLLCALICTAALSPVYFIFIRWEGSCWLK